MLTRRTTLAWVLLFAALAGAGGAAPATRPATRRAAADALAFWLGHALREAKGVEDPVVQADAYGKAAVLMARAGDVPGYRRTIALAEQALGRATTRPAKSPVEDAAELAAAPLLRAMARGGDVAGAKALAEERSKANKYLRPVHYAAVAAGQAEAGDLDGALATAGALGEYDRRTVLREVASALAAQKEFARAERVAGMIDRKHMEWRDAVRAIAAGRARAGDYDAALALAEPLPYSHDKQAVYRYVIEAQAEAGDYAAARATAARVPLGEKLAWPHPPPEYARTQAYATIAWKQLERKDVAGARETAALLDRDSKAQLEAAIAKAQIKAGDLAAARRTADAIPADAKGSTRAPREEAHEALAIALADAGDVAGAAQIARSLPRPSETLLTVAGVAVAQGRHEEARPIVRELKESERAMGFEWVDTAPASRLGIARLEKALGDPASYEAAVADLERRAAEPGEGDGVRGGFRDGVRDGPASARLQLFGLCIAEGDIDRARRLAPGLPPQPLSWVVAFAADDAARSGRMDQVKALADLMPTPEDRAAVFQSLLAKGRPAVTEAEVIEQIRGLPTAYDRSLAYHGRAQDAWIESQRPAQ